jgi:hypothetical protein
VFVYLLSNFWFDNNLLIVVIWRTTSGPIFLGPVKFWRDQLFKNFTGPINKHSPDFGKIFVLPSCCSDCCQYPSCWYRHDLLTTSHSQSPYLLLVHNNKIFHIKWSHD